MTWINSTLKEVINFGNGKSRPKTEGQIPIYGGNGILGFTGESNYDGETIIIGRVGAYCGATYFENKNIWVSDNALAAKAKDGYDSKYLYYILKHRNLNQLAQGSSHPLLTQSLLNTVDVKVNNNPIIQKTIVKILTNLDNKIAINQQINKTLEGMAQAVFKSWFVDFEPVRAKAAAIAAGGSAEDANLAAMQAISGKSADELALLKTTNPSEYKELHTTASLFPHSLTPSELGDIPEGWEVSEIGKEVTVVGGGTPSTKNQKFWENGSINWTTPKDLSNLSDKILLTTERNIAAKGLAKISSGLLPVNTVLMSSRAPVGYLALAKIPVAINQGYIAMKCDKVLSPEYVLQWCIFNMDEIKQKASGTTFAEISKSTFRPMPVLKPETKVLIKYSAITNQIYSKIENLAKQSQTLTQIRDSLLPKLLSGEIDVSNLNVERV